MDTLTDEFSVALLDEDAEQRLKQLEAELGVVLVAYKRDEGE